MLNSALIKNNCLKTRNYDSNLAKVITTNKSNDKKLTSL